MDEEFTKLDDENKVKGTRAEAIALLAVPGVMGFLVLASYAICVFTYGSKISDYSEQLWGAVPNAVQYVIYVIWFLAACGFIWMTVYLAIRVPVERQLLWTPHGRKIVIGVYAVMLSSAATWMPLSSELLLEWSDVYFALDVLFLVITGLCAGVITVAVYSAKPPKNATKLAVALNWIALIGSAIFFIQTFGVDAIYWSMSFRSRHDTEIRES